MSVKIKHFETITSYNNKEVKAVAGILILQITQQYAKIGELAYNISSNKFDVATSKNLSDCRLIKPFVVSEKEEYSEKDWVEIDGKMRKIVDIDNEKRKITVLGEYDWQKADNEKTETFSLDSVKPRKIIAFPTHFTENQLFAIVYGKMKNLEKVYIEVWNYEEMTGQKAVTENNTFIRLSVEKKMILHANANKQQTKILITDKKFSYDDMKDVAFEFWQQAYPTLPIEKFDEDFDLIYSRLNSKQKAA